MTFDELVTELQRTHSNAPGGEVHAQMILFGIMHADSLRGVKINDLVRNAHLTKKNAYEPEIRSGMKLQRYVTLK